jgi:hypothetical protein
MFHANLGKVDPAVVVWADCPFSRIVAASAMHARGKVTTIMQWLAVGPHVE